ncbi:hypothetical protein Tco_0324280 [Tanacetum coccineum]
MSSRSRLLLKQIQARYAVLDQTIHHKKGSYGPKFSKAYSYRASHIDKSIPQKEKDLESFTLPCYINNVCFDNALADLGANLSVMPLSTYLNLGLGKLAHTKLTVELVDRTVKYPKGIAENVLVGIGKFVFPVDFIILDMPEDFKVPLILERPFLSTAHAKIDVFKRKITLRVREEKIIFKSVKPTSSLIKRVYMLSLRERMELDLEARLMGETLVLNRSLDNFFEDYIELNDLNVPLDLRRDQVDDLMPTIKESEIVEEFRARNDARMVSNFFRYPSDCDHDKKIHIDCTLNLKFSCMIVLEDMDAYCDEGIGDVIFGKQFPREVGINARRFEGMITIYNGPDSNKKIPETPEHRTVGRPGNLEEMYLVVLRDVVILVGGLEWDEPVVYSGLGGVEGLRIGGGFHVVSVLFYWGVLCFERGDCV